MKNSDTIYIADGNDKFPPLIGSYKDKVLYSEMEKILVLNQLPYNDGEFAFELNQLDYNEVELAFDLKQLLYNEAEFAFELKQLLYGEVELAFTLLFFICCNRRLHLLDNQYILNKHKTTNNIN